MKDERLEELLRGLPGEPAGPGFTAGVMVRLGERRRSAGDRRQLVSLAAAAALMIAIGFSVATVEQRRQAAREAERRTASAERLEALRGELEALQGELEELRLLSAETRPVIGIGGSQEVDYLVDLRELLRARGQPAEARAQPAGFRR